MSGTDIMTEIITFAITIVSFLAGYFLGRNSELTAPLIVEKLKKRIIKSQSKPGPINRPTAKIVDKKKNKSLYEGIDETSKAFEEMGVKNG